MGLSKFDLIELLQKDFPYLKREVLRISLNVIFKEIEEGIVARKTVYLTRFGVFKVKSRKMPKLNIKRVDAPPQPDYIDIIKFSYSKKLKDRANDTI